jgi:transcriptional regulator with XRE-family HTH domain
VASDDGEVGKNLRHLMGMYDVHQRRVADLIGVSKQSLWEVVNGKHGMRRANLRAAADLFAVSPGTLEHGRTEECLRESLSDFAAVYHRLHSDAFSEIAMRVRGELDPPPAAS